MKIETKYEIDQEAFVKEDGEWWKGVIMGLYHNGTELYYEIQVPEIYRYFRLTEAEIIIDEPEGFKKSNEFLNLFPEFDQFEKDQLATLIRRLRKDAAKRTEAMDNKNQSAQ